MYKKFFLLKHTSHYIIDKDRDSHQQPPNEHLFQSITRPKRPETYKILVTKPNLPDGHRFGTAIGFEWFIYISIFSQEPEQVKWHTLQSTCK